MKAAGGPGAAGNGPMRRDTIFRIASMSKPITAAATMILVEECRLRLDDPVDRLLPELADRRVLKRLDGPLEDTVPAHRPITVRDLLTFRLGFGMVMAPPDSTPILKALGERGLGQGPPAPAATAPAGRMDAPPGDAAAHAPAGRAVDVPHGLRRAGRADRARLGPAVRDVLARAPLRAARHEGHRLQRARRQARPARHQLLERSRHRSAVVLYDAAEGGQWSRPPAFPSGGGGLVSTVDDFLAFAQMLLDEGKHGGERILSRPSVEVMTTDQLTPEQKAASDDLALGSSTATAGASAWPWSPGATACRRCPASTAGTAASAPPGARTPRRRWWGS